ncbi:hypothetical protein QE430_002774 [Microbacterium testaceum]|uniref:hypothetical protein n=1 Tax=Microbacterium TaxID=33882 RepID=UPI0027887C26|nr:hypothetical protein [Microbacterium testaceum]MDQ1174467.1 hypothetical protein [Microbacterium testaceum]
MDNDAVNVITPERARMMLDDQLSAVGYGNLSVFRPDGGGDDVALYFDESAPSAWPYYAAMLEAASTPAEVAWVGWQLIAYFFMDAEQTWPDGGRSLAAMVAATARRSVRLGSFLSEWLAFHLYDLNPAAAVLAINIVNDCYGWDFGSKLRRIRDSLPGGSGAISYVVPRSDFSPVSVRSAILWPFSPETTSAPGLLSPARQRWASANQSVVSAPQAVVTGRLVVDALRNLNDAERGSNSDTSAEQVIAGLVRCGIGEVSRDSRVVEQLADALDALKEIRPAVAWRALELLLRSAPQVSGARAGAGSSVHMVHAAQEDQG